MKKEYFEILLLLARPAAGKSEIIDYLKRCDIKTRIRKYYIGNIKQIDDFPMLWVWFEEDAILSNMGYPRLYTNEEGYFINQHYWDLLIRKLCLEYEKKEREKSEFATTIIEFSRGKEHGGYQRAFLQLSKEVVNKMAILYVDVSWEESFRKNRKRFNPDRPDSILEHSLPDIKMEKLYRESDWYEISKQDPHYISIQGIKVPYVNFMNEDDVTSKGDETLGERLEKTLKQLWDIYNKNIDLISRSKV